MDDDIVFGDALLEAVAQDKGGGPPRITLTPSVIELVRHQMGFYGEDISNTPHYEDLLEDADGSIFLNYLGEAFSVFPDEGIIFEIIKGHQEHIINGLKEYRGNPSVRAKYEWLARYHNFVCNEIAGMYQISPLEADETLIAAGAEALQLLDYRIDIESLAAMPCRMKLTPIKLTRSK